jgi:preprotein translocase subunit SecE
MSKFINYLKESYTELTKKVTWPTWSKLQNSAMLVLVATVILAVVVFAMDFAFQKLMEAIYSLSL